MSSRYELSSFLLVVWWENNFNSRGLVRQASLVQARLGKVDKLFACYDGSESDFSSLGLVK